MTRTVLGEKFFLDRADIVAPKLLGKVLVRKTKAGTVKMAITETEAYLGEKDLASHARFGKTGRNAVMFGRGGHWYVYLVYGIHWLLNIVTEKEGKPSAVLIRNGILLGKKSKPIKGPGKVTQTLNVKGTLSGKPSAEKSGLWIEDWGIRAGKVISKKRVGIDYAGAWAGKSLRFFASQSFVKRPGKLYN